MNPNSHQQVQMKIKNATQNWALWIFPIAAVILSGWVFYDIYQKRGVSIKLSFEDASGIQAEKTQVRFRGVTIGVIKSVTISSDTKDVIATVALNKEANQFAQQGAKYWLVSPKVTFQGISGLETLFEGTYIAAMPGTADGAKLKDFKVSVTSETPDALENTTLFYIDGANAESINEGDAVTFRGLQVGTITRVSLSKAAQGIVIQMNIQNKYLRLIRANTIFWPKVGIEANLGLFGSKIKVNSMESIMSGGLEFRTPDEAGPRAKAGAHYKLSSVPKDYEKWYPALN